MYFKKKNLDVSFTLNVFFFFSIAGIFFSCAFFFFQNKPNISGENAAFSYILIYSLIKFFLLVTIEFSNTRELAKKPLALKPCH